MPLLQLCDWEPQFEDIEAGTCNIKKMLVTKHEKRKPSCDITDIERTSEQAHLTIGHIAHE